MSVYVALDLEMTGTDVNSDEIIEIGAVKFGPGGVRERFSTLVNPGRSLPRRIESLTGIKAADVRAAPSPAQALAQMRAFIGDAPVVGQRPGHDLAFLKKHQIVPDGPVFDTAELAELLVPGLADYGLRFLTRHFAIDFPVQHRALPDAEATMAVFLKLRQRAAEIDPNIMHEIARATSLTDWPPRAFFREIADAASTNTRRPADVDGLALDIVRRSPESDRALTPNQQIKPVTAAEIESIFQAAAADSASFPNFEQRPEQVAMATAVAESLSHDGRLIVEAGTGTGKSLAYLLPAACFALRNNARVLVTTNTINLQEQITNKDVHELVKLLDAGAPTDLRRRLGDLRVTQMKGRRNYICLQRLTALRRQPLLTDLEARFLTRVLLWLQVTDSGDRAELQLRPEEEPLWGRVSAQDTTCFAGPSYYVRNGSCQLLRARKRAEAAHIVVANHALVLSDIASGGRALPPYERLIVDEAHNLEDEATSQFGFQAGQGHFLDFLVGLNQSDRNSGLVADVHNALRLVPATSPAAHIHKLADLLAAAADHARARIPEVFGRVNQFIARHGESGGDYDNRLLLTPAKRAQPEWQEVELAWEDARLALLPVEDAILRLTLALSEANGEEILDHDTLLGTITNAGQSGQRLRKGVDEIIEKHDGDRIAWITTNRLTGALSFSSAPLNVGQVLDDYLFGQKASVVLTSATLSTGGSFNYVKERLGLQDADELMLGSPFDYKRAALVLLPTDIPEPARREYQAAVEQAVTALCSASKGRALVLFTSHSALRATHQAVKRPLERAGLRVLGQGIDGTPKELVEALRANSATVLLGTSSFWEGVDVVGEALSLLIIAKLPFSVPTDPVFSARSALFDEPFTEYSLPQAVLRFKQGFGRLIRHKTDRGVMVVLDRRLHSKSYGRVYLNSLPGCSLSQAPLQQLPPLVSRWLNGRKGDE